MRGRARSVVFSPASRRIELLEDDQAGKLSSGSWAPGNSYLLRGLVWLAVGIGISILFVVMYRVEQDPGLLAMATLGSIPAGVGVAHLVLYRLQPKPAPPTSNQP